ncbi:MAG TPA: ABC transporter ATP-binding protein [Syntrophales bacterium]|nr:ABC transporter ATP-binding protein [Syntrophales bacterium]HQB30123.1 ABC transporter ATP-binding protein [Syntrophales bacterium]HQQ27994.1 ABC transporter ATP-binding protein [Syntrophales bacterium]
MTQETAPILAVEDLTRKFVKNGTVVEVLKGLNLTIRRGDSLAVVGLSGAGKSTLLNILGALDQPTTGRVLFKGADIFQWNERRRAIFRNRNIGFVFQSHHLLPEFTSLENAMMPALIQRMSPRRAGEKAADLLTALDLGDRLTHKPGELSGGEQQRVAIARALIMDPEILLADEPTGNLDTETGGKIQEILLELNGNRKITLVIVTHNEKLAERMTRSVGIKDGLLYELR